MRLALHWFRRDLRLVDNTALAAAAEGIVVPCYILDPAELEKMGGRQQAYLLATLEDLQAGLKKSGSRLIIRRGPVAEELPGLLRESRADALHFNRAYEPAERERDAAVEKLARAMGVEVRTFGDDMIHQPEDVLKADGKPYLVFTPYSRAWLAKKRRAAGGPIHFQPMPPERWPKSAELPTSRELGVKLDIELPAAGEAAAHTRLAEFARDEVKDYAETRDFPAVAGTSRLSPHLRFGTVSPRQVLAATEKRGAGDGVETFRGEIIWRDFYRQILWHFPQVERHAFQTAYDKLRWDNDEKRFAAWREGRTGYPIVDAGMRQLAQTGWMHNRVRMIVASFLCKDLLISWQWGERHFMEQLLDGDLASNNGGWQWSAGTGTDAQPFFRIFNPTAQAQRFDPKGEYIRRWVPEVDRLDYPPPVVEHARQRGLALALYRVS
jgi:deoxyribodipyrimidine photo-lyase